MGGAVVADAERVEPILGLARMVEQLDEAFNVHTVEGGLLWKWASRDDAPGYDLTIITQTG